MTERPTSRSRLDISPELREDQPAPARHRVGAVALWFGLLGAPAAWALHTILATVINSFECIPPIGASSAAAGSRETTRFTLVAITAVLLLVALAALVTTVRGWLVVRGSGDEGELLEVVEGRTRFMAMAGILLGAVFSFLLVMNAIALFMATQCSPG